MSSSHVKADFQIQSDELLVRSTERQPVVISPGVDVHVALSES